MRTTTSTTVLQSAEISPTCSRQFHADAKRVFSLIDGCALSGLHSHPLIYLMAAPCRACIRIRSFLDGCALSGLHSHPLIYLMAAPYRLHSHPLIYLMAAPSGCIRIAHSSCSSSAGCSRCSVGKRISRAPADLLWGNLRRFVRGSFSMGMLPLGLCWHACGKNYKRYMSMLSGNGYQAIPPKEAKDLFDAALPTPGRGGTAAHDGLEDTDEFSGRHLMMMYIVFR